MTSFESLNFVYQLIFARFDLPVWVWSILAFVLSLVLLHWLWGLAWNARWGMFTQSGMAVFSIVMALIIGGSALTWLAAGRASTWVDQQRTELTRQFADSGARNRRIFTTAREQLGPSANVDANAVVTVDENAITLRNRSDLETLARVAAADVRCPLTRSGPLGPGAPCRVREPAAVAQEVLSNNRPGAFPLTVSPDNPWIRAAVTAQVEEALSYAAPRLQAGMAELRTLAAALFGIALALQVLIVPIAAVRDIAIHPQVRE